MSLRSPLGQALGLGSAKEGAGHWWLQRVSAVGLLLLAPWFLLSLISLGDLSYGHLVSFVSAPLNTVLLSLLVITVSYHAQLGLQVVIEDYVSDKGLKIAALLLVNFVLLLLALLGVVSVLRVAFTAASA